MTLRAVLAGGACLAALATSALAQTTSVEEIVVTATGTNISGVKPVGSSAVAMDLKDIVNTGPTNITDVARTIPQIQTIGQYHQGNNVGVNSTGGSALNLRGLGAQATLLMLEGRRLPPSGTNTTYTESDFIPLNALQRIEVVPDAASAVYGSDAIAGVVNYILRKDLNGVEINGTLRTNKYFDEYNYGILAGKTWSSMGSLGAGNVMFAAEHNYRPHMRQGVSEFLRSDLRPLGGVDGRINGATAQVGTPGNITIPRATVNPTIPRAGLFDYYGLPTSPNGAITAASLKTNDPNLVDGSQYTDYLGEQKRNWLLLTFNQEINEGLTLFGTAFYNDRDTITNGASTLTAPLSPTNPFYVRNIPGVAATAIETVQYNTFKDIGYTNQANHTRAYMGTLGADFALPKMWKGEAYVSFGQERDCGICQRNTNLNAFRDQVNRGLINPFTTDKLTDAQIATFLSQRIQRSVNKFTDAVFKVNGGLFDIPGGEVKASVGAEYTYNAFGFWGGASNGNVANTFLINVPPSQIDRNTKSVFAEVYIPLIGDGNALPLVKALNLNAAARYDDYSDFGGTTNPRIGVTWEVNDDLSFRASWGKAFRAPGLPEKNPNVTALVSGQNVTNNAGDPNIPVDNPTTRATAIVALQGAGPNLGPETATLYSVGFDYKPHYIPGFKASMTYFNIDYKDQLIYYDSTVFLATPLNRQLYASLITPIHQPATCVNGVSSTYDPAALFFVNAKNLSGTPPADWCLVKAGFDTRATNGTSTKESGIDFAADYTLPWTQYGTFSVNTAVTHFLKSRQQLIEGGPVFDSLDLINTVTSAYPISWKGRSNLNWSLGGFSAGLAWNYNGSYYNNLPVAGVSVPGAVAAFSTYDLFLGYRVDEQSRFVWARGTQLSVTMLNVTDKDPPLVFSSVGVGGFGGGAFDGNVANPLGRQTVITLTKAF